MFLCFSNIKLLLQANVKCGQLHLSMLYFLVPTGWITYRFSYALRQKFEFFLGQRKAYCIFEGLSNLYWIISPINFFSLLLLIAGENRTKLKKLFIRTTKSGGVQHHNHTNSTWLFSSNSKIVSEKIWTEHDFCIISDCRNSFNNKLKNLWTSKKIL